VLHACKKPGWVTKQNFEIKTTVWCKFYFLLLIPSWVQEGKADLSDPCSVWDWAKYNIKKYSRKYSMNNSKQRKEKEKLLNIEHHEAYVSFQNNPSQENLTALNVVKEKLEKLYEEKIEGIIVRSRARWHKHGEKNSKYFF